MKTVNLTIDGVNVTVPADYTVIEAAREAGINIPTLCYLKGVNQIAYRTEAMYSYAILDPKGIAVLKKPTSTGRAAK